ncbi:MAG: diguanylate cyclase [Deinococcota bacterium]
MDEKRAARTSNDKHDDSAGPHHPEERPEDRPEVAATVEDTSQQSAIPDTQTLSQDSYLVYANLQQASDEQLAAELERLQQRYNAVLGSMVGYFVELDQDWHIQSVSRTAAESVGKPAHTLIGQACQKVFAHDYPIFEPYLLKASASSEIVTFEVLSRQFLGSWLSVHIYSSGTSLLLYAVDVSAQRKAEKAFKQSKGRLELLRQQSPLGIIEWDNDFRILTWNSAAEAIFGFTEDDMLGQSYTIFVPPDQRDQINDVLEVTLNSKVTTYNVNNNITQDGNIITCKWYNVPLTTADGTVVGVTGLVQDISREQQATDKLTRLAEFRRKLIDINRNILQGNLGNDLYQQLLEQAIVAIPDAQAGSIVLSNAEGYYQFVAAYGYDLAEFAHLKLQEQDLAISPEGRAARVYHEDFKDKLKSLPTQEYEHFRDAGKVHEIHVTLSVPINVGRDRQGILFIDNLETADAFGDDALEMAEIFAGQVGVYLRRLRLEQELREREVRNRALLEALPDTISRHDASGRYLDLRPGISFSSERPPAQLLGKPLDELINEHNREAIQAFQEAHHKARQTGQMQRAEYSFMFQGKQQYREVRVVATEALTSADLSETEQTSSAVETIAIVRDIGRQKAAEQAVLESETRYRVISDVMTDVLYAYKRNDQGSFDRAWSSGLGEVKLTGYKTHEIDALGGWPGIVHPDDAAKVNYLSHPSRRERVVVEYRIITKGGSIKWIRDFSRAVFDASGAIIIALYGANQDVTEQKLAERALESAKGDLERALSENTAILESITDSFVSVTDNWQLSYINKRALSYTAFDSAEQTLGASYFEVFPFVKENDLETIFAQMLDQQTPKQLELYWRERYVWLEMRIYPTRTGLAIYATDISERKHMELALTASNRELNQHVSELAALNTMMRTLTTATTVTQALQLAAPMVARLLNLDVVSIGLLEAEQVQHVLRQPRSQQLEAQRQAGQHPDKQRLDGQRLGKQHPQGQHQATSLEADARVPAVTSPSKLSMRLQNTPHDSADDADNTMTYLHELVRYEHGQVVSFGATEGLWHLHEDRAALLAIRDNTPIHTPNVTVIDPDVVCQGESDNVSKSGASESVVSEPVTPQATTSKATTSKSVKSESMVTAMSKDKLADEVETGSLASTTTASPVGEPANANQSEGYNLLTLPLRAQHAPIGILRLALASGRAFRDAEMELAQTVAGQIASAVSNLRLLEVQQRINREMQEANRQLEDTKAQLELKNKRLVTLSTRDALTGIYNRRHLETQLSKEFTRAVRYDIPLSVMLCDIDNFKQVNDTFSHAVGDDVLRRVATIMQQNTRDVDMVSRYGGEEFVVVFPETVRGDALQACEKIRKLVEDHPWYELARGLHVTLSQGISDDINVNNHEELLSRADKLLYKAKGAGKNRIATVDAVLPK